MEDAPVWRKHTRTAQELQRAAEALRLLGPAAVRVLRLEGDVMVLERVLPGSQAAELPDPARTVAVAEALLRLWTPVPSGCSLPTVRQECSALDDPQAVAPLAARLVAAARNALAELLGEPMPLFAPITSAARSLFRASAAALPSCLSPPQDDACPSDVDVSGTPLRLGSQRRSGRALVHLRTALLGPLSASPR